MNEKFLNLTDNIREILEKQDFTDLEKKNVSELIHEIIVYHEELQFQNLELERAQIKIESYSNEVYDLFQNAPIAYVIFDENLKIVQSNTQFQNYIKRSSEELENKEITEFISDISQDEFYLYLKNINNGIKAEPILVVIRDHGGVKRAKVQISVSHRNNSKMFRATFTDMTDWLILQDLLEESKLYYQRIIENSPYCVHGYVLDENDDLIFNIYNQAADDTLKVEHEHFIGKKLEDIFPNLKNILITERYKDIAKNGSVLRIDNYKYEDEILSGTYSLVAYQPVRNQVIIFFRDTTEENFRRTLQDIEHSISNGLINTLSNTELIDIVKQELGKIIDATNFCISLYDEERLEYHSIYNCNQYAEFGKFKAENSLADIVRSNLNPTHYINHEIENLVEEGRIIRPVIVPESWLGIPLIDNNSFIGIIIIENYSSIPKYNGETIKFLNTIANYLSTFIQRRKSDHFVNVLYRSFVHSPVSIVVTDPKGHIEYANPKCEEVTGYKFEEIKGKNTSLFRSGHHSADFYKDLWNTLLNGNVWEGKFLNRRKDGSLYWEEAKIAPVLDLNNQISNFVAIKEDITERERLIEDLKIAKESDRLKSAFLANMSHEIRTPLNAILGFSSILAEEEVDEHEKKRFSQIIMEKGEELLHLIEDLLDLSKLEVNQIKITNSIVSIPNLFDELNKTYSVLLKNNVQKNIVISFNKPSTEDLQIKTDSIRIRQILDNLINNAIKFTLEGKIEISCELAKDLVHFVVSDTGIGIAPEHQEIIFERFRQLEEDFARRKFGGVGLGLPIVKKLVELLGGNIWIESELGKGSKVHFTIEYHSIYK